MIGRMKMQAGLRNDKDGRVIIGSAFFLEMYWRSITARFFSIGDAIKRGQPSGVVIWDRRFTVLY